MPHKSEKVLAVALENNWEAEIVTNAEPSMDIKDVTWVLYAMRGAEALKAPWRGNLMECGLYTYGEYRHKLWWKTEVLKFLTGQPDPKKLKISSVTPTSVPWTDETPAIDVMLAVVNRMVTYRRNIDGKILEAVVDVNLKREASAKHFRVYVSKSGRRMLEWVDGVGFHAIALDQIINVT